MPPVTPSGPRYAPQNDLYTTLLIVAFGLLLIGTIYLVVRSSQLFGSVLPA
jgi:hypothetical protein